MNFSIRVNGRSVAGHPDTLGKAAPYFEINECYDVPAVLLQNLLMTGLNDTCDLSIRRVNGTQDNPQGLEDGESCGQLYWWPYDGTNYGPDPIYGAAIDPSQCGKAVADGTGGPYHIAVDLCENDPDDIIVFVEEPNTTTMRPENLRKKDTDYTFTYDNSNHALHLTVINDGLDHPGRHIWVFRKYNFSMTNPFYGRQAEIRAIGLEKPSRTGRGGVLVISATKLGQVVARPRVWVNGETGNLVVAGKAVAEADKEVGQYYPDRDNRQGGCPSGVGPLNTPGSGSLTALLVDESVDQMMSWREPKNQDTGFDIGWNEETNTLKLSRVENNERRLLWSMDAQGAVKKL